MEMKLPKSLIVGIWVVGIGLVLNGVQPFIGTPAAASGGIQKIAICDPSSGNCTKVFNNGNLSIRN
ncbi:hypothetical protein OAT37_05690 [Alphaproteobacteria bacterium]|nr:hypothetical protein [Alphaproteobacteria bacterium]